MKWSKKKQQQGERLIATKEPAPVVRECFVCLRDFGPRRGIYNNIIVCT